MRLLREQGRFCDRFGKPSLTGFLATVPGYHKDTWYKVVTGTRTAEKPKIERLAAALDVPPETFREYRLLQIREAFEKFDELETTFYEDIMEEAAHWERRLLEEQKSDSGDASKEPRALDRRSKKRSKAEE